MSALPPRMPPRTRSGSQTLYFQAGSSDKEYNVWIEAWANGLYSCHASWGRRGSDRASQQTADKTGGVSLARAQSVLRELIGEKVAKGYRPQAPVPAPTTEATLQRLADQRVAGQQRASRAAADAWERERARADELERARDRVRAQPAPLTPAAIARDRAAAERQAAALKPAPAVDPFAPVRRKIVLD